MMNSMASKLKTHVNTPQRRGTLLECLTPLFRQKLDERKAHQLKKRAQKYNKKEERNRNDNEHIYNQQTAFTSSSWELSLLSRFSVEIPGSIPALARAFVMNSGNNMATVDAI
jgi:hypothetical protein